MTLTSAFADHDAAWEHVREATLHLSLHVAGFAHAHPERVTPRLADLIRTFEDTLRAAHAAEDVLLSAPLSHEDAASIERVRERTLNTIKEQT